MKKRIGTKVYDTESSELIADTIWGDIYRKKTRNREWFIVYRSPGGKIETLSDAEARAMLGESSYREKEPDTNSVMIRVDRETHAVIAKKAKEDGVSITEEMRRITKNML